MDKRGLAWKKVIMYVILFIFLALSSYFLYINILDISPEPVQFVKNKSITLDRNQSSYSSSFQFYPNMRFTNKTISYYIEPECSEEKKTRMLEAFSKLEEETPLGFYQNENAGVIISCQQQKEEVPGKYFIAGEGGPTEVSNTSSFYVIEKGKVLLFYKNSLCKNYNVELHELLHVLGFKHSNNKESIMYNTTSCNQILTYDMTQELTRLYSILQLADLYFENISATKHGIYLDFDVEIRNQGLKDSEDIKLELYSEDSEKRFDEFDEFNMTSISYGEGKILQVKNIRMPSRNIKQIKFVIVSGQELDDKNNVAELFLPES